MNIIKNSFPFLFLALILSGCGGGGGNTTPPANQTSLPVAPDLLTAQVISDTQINLSWVDNSSNETSFSAYIYPPTALSTMNV